MFYPLETNPMPAPREIVYTPEIFSIQAVGGISRYFVELIRGQQAAGRPPRVVAGLHCNEHLREVSGITGIYLRFAAVRAASWRRRFNHALCRWSLARRRRAIVHLTYFGDTSYLRGQPLVVTVYDMIHELFHDRFPELGYKDDPSLRHKRRNCEAADRIIAISAATKADVVRLYGIDPEKITVIPLGSSLPSLTDAAPRPDPADAYLLHVGTRTGYKNFAALLEAFGSSALPGNFRLVCFGGGEFSADERAQIARLGVAGRVEHRRGGDAALARCYRGATAFVCPSLYEGFGLPVLEAMSQGCPVICARAGSLPEVAGDAAAYFDPQRVESIRAALGATCADPARLAVLHEAGNRRARLFTWERCSRETLEVYRHLTH